MKNRTKARRSRGHHWVTRFLRGAHLCVVVGIGFFSATSALADTSDNPPALSGWTHQGSDGFRRGESVHGIVLAGGDVSYSSPAVADIDGDPVNGLETAVGGADGIMYVYRADGSLLWSAYMPNYECASANNRLLSSPAVGKIYGDGVPHVVVGYGGLGRGCDGGVVAFRGPDGGISWTFSLTAFAKQRKFRESFHSVWSSPALGDTDGDGKMEIGFGSFDRNVYLLNANGTPRWYYNAADTVWSSPAFANVDDDSNLEMIIGTDISGNSRIRPITLNGGNVYAFKTKTRDGKRITFRDKSAFVWMRPLDQVIYSSPIVAEVLSSNPGPEVIVGSGCFFPQNSSDKGGKWVKVLSARTGKVVQTLTTTGCLSSTPAVADIDEDGVLEVIATVNGGRDIGGDGYSRVTAWKATSPSPIWSMVPLTNGRNDANGGQFMSPVVADVDGNGSLEVLAPNGAGVSIIEGRTGRQLTCGGSSCDGSVFTLYTGDTIRSTPAVADINLDGVLDIVVAGGQSGSTRGMLFSWTNLSGLLGSAAGVHPVYAAPWPMARGNAQHTAKY